MKGLYNVIKENDYKIVHVHRNSASLVMDCFIAKLCGVPVIIGHSHNTSCNIKWQHYLFRPFANLFVTDRFACSEEAGRWIFGNRKDIGIVHNAVDVERFCFQREKRDAYRKQFGLEDKYVIGFVGRLSEQKNLKRLLQIFHKIDSKEAVLMLIGDGPQRRELVEQAKRMGIEGRVLFLGLREDVGKLMSAMDVFVMTSVYEGLPIVAVEAQVAGLHTVISDKVPASDLIGKLDIVKLEESDDVWIQKIMTGSVYDRELAKQKIQQSGYDIRIEAKKLQEFYLSKERLTGQSLIH